MRIRCSDSPAPVVVDQSCAASAALIVEPHAVDAPNPEIFWCRSARLTLTSPFCAAPPAQICAPPAPPTPAGAPPAPGAPPRRPRQWSRFDRRRRSCRRRLHHRCQHLPGHFHRRRFARQRSRFPRYRSSLRWPQVDRPRRRSPARCCPPVQHRRSTTLRTTRGQPDDATMRRGGHRAFRFLSLDVKRARSRGGESSNRLSGGRRSCHALENARASIRWCRSSEARREPRCASRR